MLIMKEAVCKFVAIRMGLSFLPGKTAGWKDHFTVAMSEQFDCYWSQAFKGSKVFPMEYQ